MKLIFSTAIVCNLIMICFVLPCQAQLNGGGNNLFSNSGANYPTNTFNSLTKPSFPVGDEPKQEQANWTPANFPAFPTRYLNLPNLDDAEKEILSQNYFVVINDSNIKSFAQLYNENRRDGISSLVTADSITHALLALQNSIRLNLIDRTLTPSLESLLISMIRDNEINYRDTEDAEIKEEIKYNLAFLTVAIKLLVPDFPLPKNAGIKQLVLDELTNFKLAKVSRSVIFHRWEDFSLFKPICFYKRSASAERFYSCYQWLAKSFLELSDTISDTRVGNGNEFRRAVLLFQSIDKTKIQSTNLQKVDSGLTVWKQINKIVQDLSLSSTPKFNEQDTYLLPDNLAQTLNLSSSHEIPVSSLSNPLNRARLLLTIRSNAPKRFNSTSIFSLQIKNKAKEKLLKFHLFLPLYTPTQDLSLPGPLFQHENTTKFNYVPIALLLLRDNGVNWANKVLTQNSAKLDEEFMNQLIFEKQNSAISDSTQQNSFWKIFGTFSDPWPNETQLLFQTDKWRSFCLERQAAVWVDNFIALKNKSNQNSDSIKNNKENTSSPELSINPKNDGSPNNELATINSTIRKFGISSWRTNNNFNYLEPAFDLYNKLAENQLSLENSLNQMDLFPSEYINESHDFVRLLKRLASIAKLELNLEFPKTEDQALLGSIDKLLAIVEAPLPGKIFIPFPNNKAVNDHSELRLTGVNMVLNYPATIFAIVQEKRNYYLLRGATYSYSEQNGEEINEKHWQRQLEFGFLETPFWCQTFQRNNIKPN